jgi:hypothetical protein
MDRIGDVDLESTLLARCFAATELLALQNFFGEQPNLEDCAPICTVLFAINATDSALPYQLEVDFKYVGHGNWDQLPPRWIRLRAGETGLVRILDANVIGLENTFVCSLLYLEQVLT